MKRALAWIGRAIINHGLTKFSALVIALVYFVVTRDDVTRTFTIPLHVVQDPNRVLLTKLPDAVTVELHGSWARMSRLREQELGAAELNLSDARPGPLADDPATIVMSTGVIFRSINYEKVDLRFDRVIERAVLVRADLRGSVHPDHELVGTTIEPQRWRIRGGSGPVGQVQTLVTEPLEIEGAAEDMTFDVPLQKPGEDIDFTAVPADDLPRVKVSIKVRARSGERKLEVAVTWPQDQVAPPEIPNKIDALSANLEEIYNTWFSRRSEATHFYAARSTGRPLAEGIEEWACVSCGNVQQCKEACLACGHQALMPVFRVTAQQTRVVGQAQYTHHDQTCPACGERGELQLLGARNATLGSQVMENSWASPFNDDKKLIAFSDSVQDAAHRAGFFGARTYMNNVRTAWAHVMDELGLKAMPWSAFIEQAHGG